MLHGKLLGSLLGLGLMALSASPFSTSGTEPENTVMQVPGMTMVVRENSHSQNVPGSGSPGGSMENRPVSISNPATSGEEKVLYLTFDDGPVEGTENVLKILEEEGVEATMFCVGRHAQKRPRIFRMENRMPNLLVANHTYSHANGHYSRFYSNLWGVMSDVEHAQIVLGGRKYLRLAGRNVWRLPEVRRNDHAIVPRRRQVEIPKYEQLAKDGFYIYGWDVEWRFDHATGRPIGTAQKLADRIGSLRRHHRSAQRGKIILLAHDFMFRDPVSTEELREFIRIMKARGWSFRKIDHYSHSKPEPLYVAKYYGKKPQYLASVGTQTSNKVSSRKQLRAPKLAKRIIDTHVGSSTHSLQTQLNDAIRNYDSRQVDELIRHGASINKPDEYGRLALNTAIRANSIHLVKKLLRMGADLHATDVQGKSALITARRYKRREIEKYLIAYSLKNARKKVVAVNEKGNTIDPLKMLRQ